MRIRRLARRAELRLLVAFFGALNSAAFEATPPFSVSTHPGSLQLWRALRWSLLRIEYEAFGVRGWRPSLIRSAYTDPCHVVVLLRDARGRLFGNAFAQPSREHASAAYATSIAIDKRYRGERLAGLIVDAVDTELVRRSYRYVEFDAVTANGWADAFARRYGTRIVEMRDHDSAHGPQRYYRVRLPAPEPASNGSSQVGSSRMSEAGRVGT